MSHVAKALVALAAVGLAAWLLVTRVLEPGGGPGAQDSAPPAVDAPRVPANRSYGLEESDDLRFPGRWRQVREQLPRDQDAAPLTALLRARGEEAAASLRRETDSLLERYRYRTAIRLAEQYVEAWAATPADESMRAVLADVRAEQHDQVQARRREAADLAEAGRTQAAREALRLGIELEPDVAAAFEDFALALERRMGTAGYPAPRDPGPTAGRPVPAPANLSLRAEPSPPPALPGYPHPDVKRLDDARRSLGSARDLFAASKYQAAAKALEEIVGFYGDLRFVQARRPALAALNALARNAVQGASGLFNAASVKRDGRRVTLRYTFEDDAQLLDWETMQTLPFGSDGEFKGAREGVRGTGSTAYLLRAFFENDVEIRCDVTPQKIKTHGLVLCQHGLETRQLMWIVTNHYFVEGENYRLERPGHSVLMWGKGVNNDVPIDSPEIGFIFRGASLQEPMPEEGDTYEISFGLKGDTMTGGIVHRGARGKRADKAVGDDGRGIEKTRPGLLVVENSVVFRDVVVQGKLHPEFERERIRELLDLAALLD